MTLMVSGGRRRTAGSERLKALKKEDARRKMEKAKREKELGEARKKRVEDVQYLLNTAKRRLKNNGFPEEKIKKWIDSVRFGSGHIFKPEFIKHAKRDGKKISELIDYLSAKHRLEKKMDKGADMQSIKLDLEELKGSTQKIFEMYKVGNLIYDDRGNILRKIRKQKSKKKK